MGATKIPSTMRALVVKAGSPSPSLSFTASQPVPIPSAGQLLIRVYASAIQPSDIGNVKGIFPSTTFPRIPGRDFSGVVVSAGDNNAETGSLIGKEVFGSSGETHSFTEDGFHAEYALVPVEGVAIKPASISHVQAAAVGVPFSTALLCVRAVRAKKGETALVLGAKGSVGSALCAVLENIGCKTLKGVRGTGGDVDTASDPQLDSVREIAGCEDGVDIVIDTVGIPAMTRAAVDKALGHGGRLVFIAAPKNEIADLSFDMRAFYRFEKTIYGVNSVDHSMGQIAELLSSVVEGFESGRLQGGGSGVDWKTVKLEDAVEAYQGKGKHIILNE